MSDKHPSRVEGGGACQINHSCGWGEGTIPVTGEGEGRSVVWDQRLIPAAASPTGRTCQAHRKHDLVAVSEPLASQ